MNLSNFLGAAGTGFLVAAGAADFTHRQAAVYITIALALAFVMAAAATLSPDRPRRPRRQKPVLGVPPAPCECGLCSEPDTPASRCPDCKVVVIFDPPDVWRTVGSERIACPRHADPVSRQLLSAELEAEMPADLAAKLRRRM